MKSIYQTQNKIADQIVKLIQGGLRLWIDAAKLICSEIEKDPEFVDVLVAKGIRYHTVYALQRVGRGLLLPELVVMGGAGPLRARQLTPEVQRKVLTSPVAVVTEDGVKKIHLAELTDFQARQAFDEKNGTLRSKEQQVEWVAQVKAGVDIQRAQRKWRIGKDGLLVVNCAGSYTLAEVEEMIREMKAVMATPRKTSVAA